ncbi:type II secretion system F family protein [Methanoplanus sp. FWC-SCC4]|uniref:Type II secretion system F family protein n=1 Tax=Methanochimaera problematica TaxID=2609417 RepID=A0AA97FAC0_9EURY|nr:type II secretion system F family protein [Methanoplanus sp. FWC-SCC4]WOF15785.1 type II secretion system F family protein [Methanoplanus sp. FWC-SCC4]
MKLFGKKEIIPLEEINEEENHQQEILDKIESRKKANEGFNRILTHPVEVLTEEPINILLLSVPVALFIFLAGIVATVSQYGLMSLLTSTFIDDLFFFTILISLTPLAILDTKEAMRVRNIEVALPNFFRDVAGMNQSGMTLPNAINTVSNGDYGRLTPHIIKLNNEMSWNIPFVNAIYRFGESLGTPLARRSVDLIAKASMAGGDVSEVLRAAANDSYEFVNLADERRNNMMIYVVIVLVSFLVFLFVIAIMTGTFLATMADAGAAVAASGSDAAASGAFGSAIDMDLYRRIFSHAAMIQGFFSGLVAGQMGEGRAIGGLKYSLIMLTIAWVSFRFFI